MHWFWYNPARRRQPVHPHDDVLPVHWDGRGDAVLAAHTTRRRRRKPWAWSTAATVTTLAVVLVMLLGASFHATPPSEDSTTSGRRRLHFVSPLTPIGFFIGGGENVSFNVGDPFFLFNLQVLSNLISLVSAVTQNSI